MKQLVNPNPNIPCQPGWCLAYVESAFNTPHLYPNATASWDSAKIKHYDRPFGIAVPVYFSMSDVPEGHIAVFMPDGSVYSTTSSTSTTPTHHPSLDDLIIVYRKYHPTFKYLGWSEDLAGVRIVAPEAQGGLMTPNFIRRTYYMIAGREPSQAEVDFHMAKSNPESFVNGFGDVPLWKTVSDQRDAVITDENNVKAQLADANAKLTTEQNKSVALVENVQDLTSRLKDAQDEIKDLKDTMSIPCSETPTEVPVQPQNPLQKLFDAIVEIINKLRRK